MNRPAIVSILLFASLPSTQATTKDRWESTRNCNALSAAGQYPDYEFLPNYSVERREHDVSAPQVLLVSISISPRAAVSGSMTRPGCKLSRSFPGETVIDALIFDDKESARTFTPSSDQTEHTIHLWHLRAHFRWDATKGEGFIRYLFPELKEGLLTLSPVTIWLSNGGNKPPRD